MFFSCELCFEICESRLMSIGAFKDIYRTQKPDSPRRVSDQPLSEVYTYPMLANCEVWDL